MRTIKTYILSCKKYKKESSFENELEYGINDKRYIKTIYQEFKDLLYFLKQL